MTNIVQLNFAELQTAVRDAVRDAIQEIKSIPDIPEPKDECGVDGAEEETGLLRSAIYKLCMADCPDPIPHKKFGKKLVFSRKELREWKVSKTVRRISLRQVASDQLAKSATKRMK